MVYHKRTYSRNAEVSASYRFASILRISMVLVTLISAVPSIALSDSDIESLGKKIEALRQSQIELKKEVDVIKDLFTRIATRQRQGHHGPSTAGARLSLKGSPFRGDKDAPITIVEFSDYQCIFCSQYSAETYPLIDKEFIQTGLVRYVFKNVPNENRHPGAFKAHEAAVCAGDQNKYWQMHDLLFANPTAQGMDDLMRYANKIGLDTDAFSDCLSSGKHAGLISADITEARRGGVNAAPVFAVGLTGEDPLSFKVMQVIVGAKPYHQFEMLLETMMASIKTTSRSNPVEEEES